MEEVRERAECYGWEAREETHPPVGTYLRGDTFIQVGYTHSGAVFNAIKYAFWSIRDLRQSDMAQGKNKKETVFSWLAA